MKNLKIYVLLAAAFLCSGVFANVVFAGYAEPTYDATKLNNKQDAQKVAYREILLVRNSNVGGVTLSVASGDAVVWDTNSDDGASIRLTTTSADGAFAGIACTAIPSADAGSTVFTDDLGRNNWGYIVVYGLADAKVGAGGTNGNSAGDSFITSTDSGAITGWSATTISDATLVAKRGNKNGFFYNASDGTSTSVRVFVKAE